MIPQTWATIEPTHLSYRKYALPSSHWKSLKNPGQKDQNVSSNPNL